MSPTKKKSVIVAGLLLTFMLLAAACSTSQQTPTGGTTTIGGTQTYQAKATLSHVPTGTSDVTWSAANQTLTVKVWMSGLAPNSSHPAHIHAGDCTSDGAIVYSLNAIEADATGNGTSETTIPSVTKGIPQSGWYLNIHNGGTGLTPELQKMQIACANIANTYTSTSSDQSVHLTLKGVSANNQGASGTAQLSLADNKLTV